MPQYEIQIPGKGTFEVTSPEPLSDAQAYMAALQQANSAPPPEDKTGFMSALGASTRAGFGEAASGIGALLGSQRLSEFGESQQKKAAEKFTPTSEADIEAAYKRGILPEAGAYLSKYVTEPAGQAIGSLLGRYGAPIAGGAAAAAFAPEAAVGALGASTLGFAAVNAPIHIGENITRQKEQGQAPDYLAATVAGLGQAAIDSLGGEILTGPMKGILGKTAMEQAEPLAKRILAGELTVSDAATQLSGKLRSVAQSTAQNAVAGTGLMVGDEALRRAAAGQGITDPEAIQTYIEQAKTAAEVAPLFGLAHGLGMPGKGRDILARAEAERMGIEKTKTEQEAAQAKAEADAKDAAFKQTPEFADQAEKAYTDMQQKLATLDEARKAKIEPTDFIGADNKKEAAIQYRDIIRSAEFKKAKEDYKQALAIRAQRPAAPVSTPETAPLETAPVTVPETATPAEPAKPTGDVINLMAQHDQLKQQETDLVNKMAQSPEAYDELRPQHKELQTQLTTLGKQIEDMGGTTQTPAEFETQSKAQLDTLDKKIEAAKKTLATATDPNNRDYDAADKASAQIKDLTAQREKMATSIDEARSKLQAKETPKGENIPLFTEEQAPTPKVEEGAKPAEEAKPAEAAPAEKPQLDTKTMDLFSEENTIRTAIRNGDTKTLEGLKTDKEKNQALRLDTKAIERERMIKALDDRLDLTGRKVTRANPEQVEVVMKQIETIKNKFQGIEGNAKKSYADKLHDLADKEKRLLAEVEKLKATGKSAVRKEKQLEKVRSDYKTMYETHVQPQEKKIERLYRSLYKVEEAKSASEEFLQKRMKETAYAQPELGAAKDFRAAYDAAVKAGAEDFKYKGRKYDVADAREIVSPRKIGPVVRNVVTAGNIRTGDTSTSGERTLSTANKATQAGQARKLTAKEIKSQEAEKRMDAIDAMRPKIAAAIDEAEANKNTERFKNLSALEAKHDKEYAELEKIVAYKPPPSKVTTAEDIAAIQKETDARFAKSKKFQEGQEREAVPLSEAASAELERGSVAGALADVADNSKSDLNRAVAQRLKMLLGETKATIETDLKTPEGKDAYGSASVDGRNISLDRAHGLNEETLLHESVHAATERILQMPEDKLSKEQLTAKRELQALHEAIKNDPDITSKYAKGDLSEFVAEALSNKELQDQLHAKKWTLRNAWDSFKKILMDMLGIKVPENMLDATLASADTLFARPERITEPTAPTRNVFRVAKYDSKLDEAGKLAERLIATQRPLSERMNASSFGRASMEFMVKMVDQYAPLEKLSKQMDSLNGTQMMHYLRMVGQRYNLLGQTVGIGAPELKKIIRADGRAEWVYEAKEGPSLVGVAKALQPANQLAGSPEAANNLFSLYSIAQRAESVGLDKLNYKNVTQAQLDKALAEIKAVPGLEATFKNAHAEYEKFNRNMVKFGVDTGVFSKEMAAKMTKNGDYVPYYRENSDGSISMLMGQERIANMGNVKEQPYLHELVGGDQRIADFMTSSVNNANMILEMGLRNQATKNVAFELEKIGMAKIGNGTVRSGPNVIKYKLDGKDKYAVIEGTPDDIPPELLVKGMEGIPVQTSALLKLAGMPSRVLREMFVANPISAGRILFKDTISSAMTSGSNFDGIRAAMRNVGDNLMERRGISGGEVYTGLPQDLTKILRQVQSGKPGWETLLAKANVLHAKADAMTRQIRYESYLKQGLSVMQANHMALESMNFTRRGISPSIHVMNALHPFLNSQIQGLNTLIKAIRGNMPMNEKLRIREKIIKRGMLLGGATMLYSSLMQDDETYKNALPDQKYNNFFVPFPGIDEKVRVPIPFEAGILFKSVPEALMNYMYGHDKEAGDAMRHAILKLIPAGESYGVPQILTPAVETALGKSFYTGRDIESRHEQSLVPGMRTRDSTTGAAAELGKMLDISPVKLDHLISGYTGQLGLAVTQMASALVFGPKMAGPEVAKHLSQMPLIGSTFQPKDAGAVVEDTYQMMTEASQVKNTYQDLLKKGNRAEAEAFLSKNADAFARSQIASQFPSVMKQYTDAMTAIKSRPDMSPEEKLRELDRLKEERKQTAEKYSNAAKSVGKTTPQPALQ